LEKHKTDIISKNFDIINFVVSLIIKAVAIPFLSNQPHQPIRHKKVTLPTSCKTSEFFEKSPLSGAGKHPDFQGQVDRGNFTLSPSENRT